MIFLFGAMVTCPEIGERFVKSILKVICGSDSNLHGARLDVYTEPEIEDYGEERAAVYDIEPDCNDSAADKKAPPRRMRICHGKIAARSLNAGADYEHVT